MTLHYYCINNWISNYQRGKKKGGWYPTNSNTLLCLSQARTWISNAIFHGSFFVFMEVRGGCTFYWQSLFKLSFHNDILHTVHVPLFVINVFILFHNQKKYVMSLFSNNVCLFSFPKYITLKNKFLYYGWY